MGFTPPANFHAEPQVPMMSAPLADWMMVMNPFNPAYAAVGLAMVHGQEAWTKVISSLILPPEPKLGVKVAPEMVIVTGAIED